MLSPANNQILPQDAWNNLTQASRPTKTPLPYLLLLSAIDAGWMIVEPVYYALNCRSEYPKVITFTLKHPNNPCFQVLFIPFSNSIKSFIQDQAISVI